MSELRDFLNEQLQDKEFKELWDNIQPEIDVIRAVSGKSIPQNLDLEDL